MPLRSDGAKGELMGCGAFGRVYMGMNLGSGELLAVKQRMENDKHIRRAFVFFDKDGSGYIEFSELREGLRDESGETDNEVLNDIMREVDDTDEDGRISYMRKFVAMMKTGTDWRKASRQYSRERFKSFEPQPDERWFIATSRWVNRSGHCRITCLVLLYRLSIRGWLLFDYPYVHLETHS